MIDDAQMNCQIAPPELTGRPSSSRYCIALKKQALLASKIARMLSLAVQDPTPSLVAAVVDLDKDLANLKEFIRELEDLDVPPNTFRSSSLIKSEQATYLRMAHNVMTFDIHTALTYPWMPTLWSSQAQNTLLLNQIQTSIEAVARTARDTILATQFLNLDATSPILYGADSSVFQVLLLIHSRIAFHAPMYALINLFVHILRQPNESTQSDLNLLEIGAAHFSRLELATESEVSFPFVRDLVALARTTVTKAKIGILPVRARDIVADTSTFQPFASSPNTRMDFSEDLYSMSTEEYFKEVFSPISTITYSD